jgi:RNA polymerase sigma factor (TIGR02999 family)
MQADRPEDYKHLSTPDAFQLIYNELKSIAHRTGRRVGVGGSMQTTALVHEAFLRLRVNDRQSGRWSNRAHFVTAVTDAIRWVILDQARSALSRKRGGQHRHIQFDEGAIPIDTSFEELLELDEAISSLADLDAVKAEVVKLRFFAGFQMKEIAKILELSESTVERHWAFSRAWLRSHLGAID